MVEEYGEERKPEKKCGERWHEKKREEIRNIERD